MLPFNRLHNFCLSAHPTPIKTKLAPIITLHVRDSFNRIIEVTILINGNAFKYNPLTDAETLSLALFQNQYAKIVAPITRYITLSPVFQVSTFGRP